MASFAYIKPQPEHSEEELALTQRIPPGVTSGTERCLWDSRRPQGTRLEEVEGELRVEREEGWGEGGALG